MNRSSPTLAAILSFLWPGVGHAYLGRRRAAIVFAFPLALALLALVTTAAGGVERLVVYVITPAGAMTVFVLVVLTGIWRLIALADAAMVASRGAGRMRRRAAVAVAGLMALVIASHGAVGYLAYAMYDASSRIFVAAGPDDEDQPGLTGGSFDPAASNDSEYLATPIITPSTASSRVNILLTGIDAASTRSHSLTDTLLVVSINPADRSVAMLSLPRDIAQFPLYNGGTYTGKINSLMTWARNHPASFPDGPLPTLINEVGYLIGVPIHYYAAVDLDGFRRMIEEVGGVTVVNDRAIDDPRYDWLDGTHGFYLPAGRVTLDGRTALAFVRSRQGVGDSDFTRARRQQVLLLALRSKLTSPDMLPKLPAILRVAGDTIRTNLPTDRLDEFVSMAGDLQDDKVKRYVLGPPYAVHPPTDATGGVYILRIDEDKLAALSIKLFGDDSRYASQ